jgi:DNA-binding beta-propeller fold protein YncE
MKYFITIRKELFLCMIILISFSNWLRAQTLNEIESTRVSLPNGWKLTPVGNLIPLGDLPLNIAISPSKKLAAITNNGESDQTIQLADIEKEIILDSVVIGKSWLGLTFSADGRYLYASGGNDNLIVRYAIQNRETLAGTDLNCRYSS